MKSVIRKTIIFSAVSYVFIFSLFSGCSSRGILSSQITFTAVRRDFTVAMAAEGVLEARKSHIIVAPIIWPHQPTIAYLALEGAAIRKGEVAVRFASDKFEKDLEDARRELEIAHSDARQTEVEQLRQRSQLESRIKASEAAAEDARLQLARLDFVAPREREIKRLEIARSDQEAEKDRRKLAALEAVQKQERNQKSIQVGQAGNKLKHNRLNLEKLTLRSPADGFVVYETNEISDKKFQAGDVLYPGMAVVRIPDMSELEVRLQLSETEVQGLAEGQKAVIGIPSLGESGLPGHVSQVAKVAKPAQRNSKVKKVEVTVAVDTTLASLVPGLSCACSIVIESLPSAVVVPLESVFEKDSLRIVYVRQANHFIRKEVTLGPKNTDFAVVSSGLEGGESLALHEPPGTLVKQ